MKCTNSKCDRELARSDLDPRTKMCAACVYEARLAQLLEKTWVDEATPEFAAADQAYDEFVAAGLDAISAWIWSINCGTQGAKRC